MGFAEAKPEATSIRTADLLHPGDRDAVARSLCRLAHAERLLWICRGVYMLPSQTRIDIRTPRREKALAALAKIWGETIVPNGGGAANCVGLTTQSTVESVHLTSGFDRFLDSGAH